MASHTCEFKLHGITWGGGLCNVVMIIHVSLSYSMQGGVMQCRHDQAWDNTCEFKLQIAATDKDRLRLEAVIRLEHAQV